MSEILIGQKWRHKKRGGVYQIIALDASVQIAYMDENVEMRDWLEAEKWIVYRSIDTNRLFVRLYDEFTDGRFELVKDQPQ